MKSPATLPVVRELAASRYWPARSVSVQPFAKASLNAKSSESPSKLMSVSIQKPLMPGAK
jgi:hypothetical protein